MQVWDAARTRDHRFFQHIDKIDAGAQGIDIDEDLGFAEMRGEPVVHVSDVREGVVAPVADKDPQNGESEFFSAMGGRIHTVLERMDHRRTPPGCSMFAALMRAFNLVQQHQPRAGVGARVLELALILAGLSPRVPIGIRDRAARHAKSRFSIRPRLSSNR